MYKVTFEQIPEEERTKDCTSLFCEGFKAHFRGIIEDGSEAFLCTICITSYFHTTIHSRVEHHGKSLKKITLEIEEE